ncbi:MAG: family 43 glycosylhydrolase [Bacteroidaceae bacterium]|nr:family 43 glycosylhydrolase [Bacteroidaceae bacterium]
MKTKSFLLTLAAVLSGSMFAQNPIISNMFTPDPAPFVYGDKVYLFVDHDEEGSTYFHMKDWMLYSTEDMVNWTYLGTMITTETFAWAKHGDRAWASQGVERNGKWYWYVCCNTASGGDALAVAVADDPQGPWTDAIGGPLAEGFGFIDPTVFIDDDGKAYLFWGNKGLWYGELNDDMVSFRNGWQEVPGYHDPECFGELQMKENWANGGKKELMTQYEEGPWLVKRNGTYILSYPAGGVPEHMAYSTAPTINGPWTYRGRIMDEAENSFTIHGGNITFQGRDFMFYHNGALPGGGGFCRSACVEEFRWNDDGSFPFIPQTKEGVVTPVKNLDPYSRVEAETQAESRGLKVDRRDGKDHFVTNISDGDWIRVRSVDFKDCGQKAVIVVVGEQKGKGTIEFYTDNMEGEPFCKVPVNRDNAGFPTAAFTYLIDSDVQGVHDVYIVFRCETPEPFTFDWWQFNAHANMPVVQTRFTADPAPVVINDKVYLYTTHDEDGARGFQMFDWLLYTSDDMVNWQDHGAVASLDDFKYYDGKNGAWAEQVVAANGAYYMYCPIHGHGIGVLTSDSPYGPFYDPIGEPLVWQKEHWDDIDPTVLIDDDGQAYMYWGNPNVYSVKLGKDMISLDGPITKHPKIEDYQEGPWIWKHDGHYYLAFASTCCPEGIGYAMSEGPEGPWEYKGHIMDHTVRTRGNHPGIIEFQGKNYVFGLNYDIMHLKTFAHAEQRSVSVAEMHYNEDGTIQEVPYFIDNVVEQVAPFNPFRRVEAETMAWGYGLKTTRLENGVVDEDGVAVTNMYVHDIDDGEYILLRGVDFGRKGAKKMLASVGSDGIGCIEVHLDSPESPAVAVFTINATGGKTNFSTLTRRFKKRIRGTHDLYLVFTGAGKDLFTFDWWRMK